MQINKSWKKYSEEYLEDTYATLVKKGYTMTFEEMVSKSHGEIIDLCYTDPQPEEDEEEEKEEIEEDSGNATEEEIPEEDVTKRSIENGRIELMKRKGEDYIILDNKVYYREIDNEIIAFGEAELVRKEFDLSKYEDTEARSIESMLRETERIIEIRADPRMFIIGFFPTEPNEFSRLLGILFKKHNRYDSKNKSWYCYDPKVGRWVDTESDENFILMGVLMGDMKKLYRYYKIVADKYIRYLKDKLLKTMGAGMTYERGSYNKTSKKYNKCKIKLGQLDIDEGSKEMTPKAVEDILPRFYTWDKVSVMADYLGNSLADNYNFVPATIKACRYYFIEPDFGLLLDTNPYMMNFKNCVLYIKENEKIILPHSPGHMIGKTTGYNLMDIDYVETETKILMDTMNNSFTSKEKTDCMLRTKAYSLVGKNPAKKFFIDYGEKGNNGKGVVDTLMKKSYGEYHAPLPKELICKGKMEYDPERPQSSLYNAMQCRYVSLAEPSHDAHLSADSLKHFSSGGDSMQIRKLNKNSKTKVPFFTLYCATNFFPDFDGFDNAVMNRLAMIKWEVEFVKEKLEKETKYKKTATDIKERIDQDDNKYASAWMWILINNYTTELNIHKDFIVDQEKQIKETDYIKEYMDECVVDTYEDEKDKIYYSWITRMEIYQDAKSYYWKNGYTIPTKKIFIRELEKHIKPERINISPHCRKVHCVYQNKERGVRDLYKHYALKKIMELKDSGL